MKPIYDAIVRYSRENPARFHMPAHFGVRDDGLYASAPFDVTELGFSDNLQNPSGIIAESEKQCAKIYGAKRSFYLTSGSTTGIFVALSAIKKFTDEVIVARASHKSVYAAVRLLGLTPRYIPASFDQNGIPLPVTPEDVKNAIEKYPSAGAVIITSPNYFGMASDPRAISGITSAYDKLLVVDEAHGAHFPFAGLSAYSFAKSADVSVTSLHKTLPVYSGGAVINCNNECLFDEIAALRADLHTTSPCYLTLASMDYALDEFRADNGKKYDALYEKVTGLKNSLGAEFVGNNDYTRLVCRIGDEGFSALSRNGVVPEMRFNDLAVFILSPVNASRTEEIRAALIGVAVREKAKALPYPTPVSGKACGEGTWLTPNEAVGHTALREVGAYPPGIPVVAYGETITREIADVLQKSDVFGFVNDRIYVTIDKTTEVI